MQKEDLLLQMAMENFGDYKDKGVWWLKDMTGYLDHTHEVRMVLATDNNIFKGAYEILSSKQRFYLEGQHDGAQIVLIESDSLDKLTGYIKGDMNDDKFYCEWTTTKNTDPVPLFVYHNSPSPNPCGNVGWAYYYVVKTNLVDSLKSITAIKKEDQTTMKIRYKNSIKNYEFECENDACDVLRKLSIAFDDQEEMILNLKNNTLEIKSSEGKNTIDMTLKKSMYFNCHTYLDFDQKFSFLYPFASDKKFNEYIQSEYVGKYMGIESKEYVPHGNCSIYDRNIHMEYGDINIDWFSDTMVSGVFTFQSSNSHEVEEYPFNYHFLKKKAISMSDIFLEKFIFEDEKNKYIAEWKKNNAKKNEEDYFKDSKYDIVTVTPNGFCCKTKFNTVYGEDTIIIPYSYFNGYFNKKPIIR